MMVSTARFSADTLREQFNYAASEMLDYGRKIRFLHGHADGREYQAVQECIDTAGRFLIVVDVYGQSHQWRADELALDLLLGYATLTERTARACARCGAPLRSNTGICTGLCWDCRGADDDGLPGEIG